MNLKIPVRVVMTLLCLAGISCAAAQDAPAFSDSATPCLNLSREDCIRIALQDNPTVKVADMEVRRADYSKKETLAALFPSIDFSGSFQRTIELQTIRMNMGGQSQSLKMGSDNMWNFGFSATLPLVSAQLWKSISLSDTQILQNLESARASRLDLVDQVSKAYYGLLLAKSSLDVIRQNYEVAKENADIYQKQFDAGTASEYDVLRSSVQVKNIEPEMLQAEIAVRQCKLQLLVLMGIDSMTDIEPTVTLDDLRRQMTTHTNAYDRSLAGNTSLRSLDLSGKLLKQNVEMKKMAFIPTLGATYNISWNALSNGSPFKNQEFNPYSTVGLALQVPIFQGGKRVFSLRQAEVQYKEMALQRENLVNSLNMQIDLAIDNINKQARQIDTSAEGVRQAEKAHQIMQKSFEIGAATYLNLRDSELAETTAKLAYYQAIHTYLVSTADLDLLLGNEEALGGDR